MRGEELIFEEPNCQLTRLTLGDLIDPTVDLSELSFLYIDCDRTLLPTHVGDVQNNVQRPYRGTVRASSLNFFTWSNLVCLSWAAHRRLKLWRQNDDSKASSFSPVFYIVLLTVRASSCLEASFIVTATVTVTAFGNSNSNGDGYD